MTPEERAEILLNKYSLEYIKWVVNGMITQYHKEQNMERINHWNDIARYIKSKL
jgi:hypothetical protein